MSTDFASLKRQSKTSLEEISKEAAKLTQKGYDDKRFWSPSLDKAGNGAATFRFLPAPAGEKVPFVRYFSHGFQRPAGWFIENCPTSIGQDCPCCDHNSILWKSGVEEKINLVKFKQKRKLHYVSNILVINDPDKPDNNGKVFLFQYGVKIFEKLNNLMHPTNKLDPQINPFDPWEGVNFNFRQKKVKTGDQWYPNFDDSFFDKEPSPIHKADEAIKEVWDQQHLLQTFVAPEKFKSYADLEKRLNKVLDVSPSTTKGSKPVKAATVEEDDEEDDLVESKFEKKASPAADVEDADDFFKDLEGEES